LIPALLRADGEEGAEADAGEDHEAAQATEQAE
jgi:hypothetical protein